MPWDIAWAAPFTQNQGKLVYMSELHRPNQLYLAESLDFTVCRATKLGWVEYLVNTCILKTTQIFPHPRHAPNANQYDLIHIAMRLLEVLGRD